MRLSLAPRKRTALTGSLDLCQRPSLNLSLDFSTIDARVMEAP